MKTDLSQSVDSVGPIKAFGILAVVGALVGLGQMLAEQQALTPRSVIGRCLTSGGLGASAAAVLTWLPELPFFAQLGIAAMFASLGTSGLTLLAQRILGRGQ